MASDIIQHPQNLGRRKCLSRLALGAGLAFTRNTHAQGSRQQRLLATFIENTEDADLPKTSRQKCQFELWARRLKNECREMTVDLRKPFESSSAFIEELRTGPNFHIFPMYGYDFVQDRENPECLLEPIIVPLWDQGPQVAYSLYVNKNSPIRSLRELGGQQVNMEIGGRGLLPKILFHNALEREKIPNVAGFCIEKLIATPLRAVLPVYFGKESGNRDTADACIISKTGINQLLKGNPEIEGKLEKIYDFKPVLSHVIAYRRDLLTEAELREIISISSASTPAFIRYDPLHLEQIHQETLTFLKREPENLRKSKEEPHDSGRGLERPKIASPINPTFNR